MASGDNEVKMMMSVYPGAMTGFAAMNAGLSSILNVFNAATRAFDYQFNLLDTSLTTTAVVVTQLGASAMQAFGEFEQGMKIVQMVSGQTAQDMNYLKQVANDFSVQYRTDIDQITDGLQTLGRAGLNSASEQAEVLENGLNTAKLEGRDLNGVLEELIQNTALLGGDLKSSNFGEDSEYVNNLLVATSMTAPITTHDVSETLKYSGGIAAAAGANIESDTGKKILEDYMGAIAAFAQKGVTGSIAGTALRAFFNKPATQDSSVKEALGQLKLKPEYLWEDDEETMKPVSEQIALIQGQMDKLDISTMDRLQIWSKIVGGKMGQQMMKLDSEDIKDITNDIQSANDASSLAAGSMQTFQANLKAAGEAGAVLERNIGEKLVYFANPILEIIKNISSFLSNDFMAWPLAAGIIGFFGYLIQKIRQVASLVKSEISTLWSLLHQGVNPHLSKQGVMTTSDTPWGSDKSTSGSSGSSKSDSTTSKKSSEPTTLSAYAKQYANKIKASGALTLEAFQKANISADKIALAGHLSGLTSAKNKLGVPEGQLWAAAIKNNVLTDSQLSTLQKGMASGLTGRNVANLLGIDNIIPQIKQCEQALKDLGIAASHASGQEQKAKSEKVAAEIFESEAVEQTKQKITEEEIFRDALNAKINENYEAIKEQVYNEGLDEAAKRKEARATLLAAEAATAHAHSTALGTQEWADRLKTFEVNAKIVISEIEASFINMARNIEAFNLAPATSKPYVKPSSASILGGYTPLPSNIHKMMETPYIPFRDIEQRARELRAAKLKAQDDAARARDFEEKYRNPYIPTSSGRTRAEARIDDALRGKRLEDDFKEYDEAQAQHYKRLFNKHVDNLKSTYQGAGVGGVSGRLGFPSNDAVEASIKANEEAARQAALRTVYTSRGSLSSETSGMGRFGVGLTRDEIKAFQDEAKRQADKANLITKSHPDAVTSGMGKFGLGKQGIKDIQERTKEIVTSTVRKVNDAVVNGASSGLKEKGITTRSDINKIREESHKQWRDARNQRMAYSMPQSNIPFKTTSDFEKRVEDRLERLHKNQEARARAGGLFPAQQQRILEANKQAEQYIKGGWGTNQALSYYNLTPAQLDQITKAEKDNWTKSSHFGEAFRKSFSDRINRDRMGSFLSFGKERGPDGMRSATKGLSGLANKALNLSDAFGGPLMIAIMAVTTAIQLWQQEYQKYTESLQKAEEKLKDAYSARDSAEDSLRQSYRDQNSDATEDEIDQMIYDTYTTMADDFQKASKSGDMSSWLGKMNLEAEKGTEFEYDEEAADGTMKEKEEEEKDSATKQIEAIKENTGALYMATAELNVTLSKMSGVMTDSWWGLDGWTGWLTDQWGGAMDQIFKGGSKFSDENEFLLTQSQADENYSGYTEMAGLMMEDFKDAKGNWIRGMRTMMGNDVDDLVQLLPKSNQDWMKSLANSQSGIASMSGRDNAKIQASMKNDSKTWKKLAREYAKLDVNKKTNKSTDKNVKAIRGITQKLQSTLGKGFNETHIKQAAYLMQMQEMYNVAQNSIVPIISTNTSLAGSTLIAANGIGSKTGDTANNAGGTWGTAQVISGLVAIIAKAKAKEVAWQTAYEADPNSTDLNGDGYDSTDKAIIELAQKSDSPDDFAKEAAKLYNTGLQDLTPYNNHGVYSSDHPGLGSQSKNMAPALYIAQIYEAAAKMTGYNYSADDANAYAQKQVKELAGKPLSDIYNTFGKNYTENPAFHKQIIDNYLAATDDDGDGSGSGGSGSGSGDKNKDNTGTKKERVDLVLCNKKEIPKLNVNLFKKPPSFTILNKNFKLRDIKVNTQDKPKAVLASIKNAIIDVQKRTDPKIIQDEDAVYDPAAATDGNNVPTGKTDSATDR